MRTDPLISVILAVRNERGNIAPTVEGFADLRGKFELIFVDGHSTDGTREEIERCRSRSSHPVIYALNDGPTKKTAVVKGLGLAKGDIVLVYDCDGEIGTEEIPKLLARLRSPEGAGLFLNTTRFRLPMEKKMHGLNRLGNKVFVLLMSALTGTWLTDPLCGLKGSYAVHYKEMLKQGVFANDLDWFAEFDQLFGAKRLNLVIEEIPVTYHPRRYGETKVRRFRVGWQLLKRIVAELL